jgi:hypothetical protein
MWSTVVDAWIFENIPRKDIFNELMKQGYGWKYKKKDVPSIVKYARPMQEFGIVMTIPPETIRKISEKQSKSTSRKTSEKRVKPSRERRITRGGNFPNTTNKLKQYTGQNEVFLDVFGTQFDLAPANRMIRKGESMAKYVWTKLGYILQDQFNT